ncbi:MAG: hypothetical protein ACRCZF_02910, partial [Gemmataceae bacterium]
MRHTLRTFLGLSMLSASVSAADIGFIEDYTLGKDRPTVLKQLIPGTEDYYYYQTLQALNSEQFKQAEEYLRLWRERIGETPRYQQLRTRLAFLTYGQNPDATLQYLRDRMQLQYNHQRLIPGGVAPNLPTKLDPNLIRFETLRERTLRRGDLLNNVEDTGLEKFAGLPLDAERRRNLLTRLRQPDIGNLPQLIVDDFSHPFGPGFGGYPVNGLLTTDQLLETNRIANNQLTNNSAFVNARLMRLRNSADADNRNPAVTKAYFDRLLAYVRTLNEAHNSLKAHVLFHKLQFDRTQGVHDKALILEYLKLPRQQAYMHRTLLESEQLNKFAANLGIDYAPMTGLPTIGADEQLVRAYLKHFFTEANNSNDFKDLIHEDYLKHLFAEAKIEAGLGEAEQWASALPPELYAAIKSRIDLEFVPTNKPFFGATEAVTLDVDVKNVPTLLVKIYEIHTKNYYERNLTPVTTDTNLDGLVPNASQNHAYPEPPVRRVRRTFQFPELTKPGVYVIDFIGSGKSSRALVRKGQLTPLV